MVCRCLFVVVRARLLHVASLSVWFVLFVVFIRWLCLFVVCCLLMMYVFVVVRFLVGVVVCVLLCYGWLSLFVICCRVRSCPFVVGDCCVVALLCVVVCCLLCVAFWLVLFLVVLMC